MSREEQEYLKRLRPEHTIKESTPLRTNAENRNILEKFKSEDRHYQKCCDEKKIESFIGKDSVGVNYVFNDGETPLIRAIKNGHGLFAFKLIEHGAALDATDSYDRTPLHWAAQIGRADIAQLLIENGANTKLKDTYGFTPLKDELNERGYMDAHLPETMKVRHSPDRSVSSSIISTSPDSVTSFDSKVLKAARKVAEPIKMTSTRHEGQQVVTPASKTFRGKGMDF